MAYNETKVNKTISFWHFIQEYAVEIPIIQRDYAQGRLGEEYLRYNFLTNLKQALDGELPDGAKVLTLDFVYGSQNKEKSKSYPLDGQQRLTTLWLLHWYIALKAGTLEEVCGTLKKFSYETRISSREFCQELCNYSHFQKYDDAESIVDFITSRTWFYAFWKQDPTIQAMLRMIRGTKISNKYGQDIVDGLEELFQRTSGEKFKCYWEALTSDTAPIVFYHLPLENFGLTDDLYIKMNARGKQLTSFENFKADFIGHIKEQAKDSDEWKALLDPEKHNIPIKLDNKWTDIFLTPSDNNEEFDKSFFAFLNRYFLNCAIIRYDATEKSETWKLYGKESDDSSLSYNNGFDIYSRILSGDKGLTILHDMERLFDNLGSVTNVNEYLPKWFKKFDFIPIYTDKSISTLTQPQRVVFFGICRYFESCTKFNRTHFRRWMRVVCNLVENTTISMIEAMIARMKLINELSVHIEDIYEYLSCENLKIKSKASSEQLAEEIEKAKQILKPQEAELPEKPENWDENKEWNWETAISEAEGEAFFNGAIRFLFRNKNNEWDWNDYSIKWKNSQALFGGDAYKGNSTLLHYFLSKFTKWEMFWKITFDKTQTTWRSVLLDKKWSEPVSEVLISNHIGVNADYHSNFTDPTQKEVQEELVTSKLLDHIVEGCELNYKNDKYVLYPYNKKADWKKYVIANNRNRILSSLYGGKLNAEKQPGKIYTDQKIDDCDFFWGWNIRFQYVKDATSYSFQWQHDNWIDMFDGDKCLCENKNIGFYRLSDIKNEADLIEKMNQCIDHYMNAKRNADQPY